MSWHWTLLMSANGLNLGINAACGYGGDDYWQAGWNRPEGTPYPEIDCPECLDLLAEHLATPGVCSMHGIDHLEAFTPTFTPQAIPDHR